MMAENESEILSLALNAYHAPLRYQDWWGANSELPQGTNLLLRIASGDTDFAEGFCQVNNTNKKDLQEAATFFIKQAFFAQGASYYRILGLDSQADQNQIKEHYRLLMRLFHPDRRHTQGAWTDSFAGRVNQAYNILRKPELRQEYDNSLRSVLFESSLSTPSTFIEPSPIPFIPVRQAPPRSRNVKYLPYAVMAGVSLLSVLFLINAYFSNDYHVTVNAGQELAKTTSGRYVKSNNQHQPNDTVLSYAELSEVKRDLVEDHESLKIPDKPSPEIPDIKTIANLQTKKDVKPVTSSPPSELSSLPSRESPSLSHKITKQPPLPESKPSEPVPALATQTKVPTSAVSKSSKSIRERRSELNSEIRKSKEDTSIRSSSVNTKNKKPATTNTAIISSTYKQSVNKKSAKPKNIQSAKVESNAKNKLVRPETQSKTKTRNISNDKKNLKPKFSERELRLLLGRFVSAYERGDLTTLMSLFTEQARAGGKRGKAKIRQEYKNLFDNTRSRRISLNNIVWRQAGKFFRGDGQFRLRTSPTSQQGSTQSSGKVSFEVEQRNGRLFIRGFYHQLGG